jgi:2-keto-3-deoxy-L-rhamnonate aldolase RhmA
MRFVTNGIRDNYEKGLPALGSYLSTRSTQAVEMAALGGLDFVRIDTYKHQLNPEQQNAMMYCAYSMGLTPWVRCRNDPWDIMQAIDNGALVVSMKIGTLEDAQRALEAVRYPPVGKREPSRPKRCAAMPQLDYWDWYNRNVLLAFQLESPAALENWEALVKFEGADIIEYGKGGMGAALGLPESAGVGSNYRHPTNTELDRRVQQAALEAGKQVASVTMLDDQGIEDIQRLIERGVLIHIIDGDGGIMQKQWRKATDTLRPPD